MRRNDIRCTNSNGTFYIFKRDDLIGIQNNQTVNEFHLLQNYPNPFNPFTNIMYTIVKQEFTTLKVYDILGKEIAVLVNEEKLPGRYQVTFNAANLASGVYFYTLTTGDFKETKKMVLVK